MRLLSHRAVHLATRLELMRESASGTSVPGYVEREFRRYLECGILAALLPDDGKIAKTP